MESSLINSKKYYNLSEPQKMIYWGEFLHPNSSLNTVCVTYELEDQNDVGLLKKVIEKVIKENPGLHLRIHNFQGIPYQYKCDDESYTVQLIDFSNETNNKQESNWIEEKATYSFNFFDSRLFNFHLYKSYDSSINMMIQLHHIISDAWTHQSLSIQIFEKYKAISNKEEDIYKSKYSYLDYINTEKDFLNSPRAEKCLGFWKDKFKNVKEIPLYTDSLHKKTRSNSERYRKYIDDNLQIKIQNITTNNKISLPTFFLGCLLVTLQKLYKKDSHFIGTLTYNRLGKKEKDAVGMFVNTLPMFFNLDEVFTFRDISQLIDLELMGIMRNQRFPLSQISNSEELKDLDLAKKIQIIYSYQNVILPYNYVFQDNKSTNYPILFRPTREGLDGKFHIDIDYQIDCFSKGEIKNIADVFLSIIEDLEDVDAPIDFKNEFNLPFTKKNYNLDRTLHSIFEDKVNKFPDNIAISFGEESLTYYELNRRANFLAKELIKEGCKVEDPVVLVLNRSLEMMISILAVLKVGGCYLPMSPEQPINRIKKVVELSGSKIIIYNNKLNEKEFKNCTFFNAQNLEYPVRDFVNPNVEVKPNNLAYIIYTSGSTGEPKGVMIEHKSVINRLLWMQDSYPLDESDRILQKTPYTFDVSVWELFGWYINGSSLHFLEPSAEKEPHTIVGVIKEKEITVVHFVPSMFSLFLEFLDKYGDVKDINSLRRISCSGEAILVEHVEKFKNVTKTINKIELYNLYGPTEATVEVSYFDCLENKNNFVPIGKPIDNVELYVLDKDGNVLPAGESGELFIGGVCLARGYFKRPDLTDDKFKINSVLNKRLYATGDLAQYLDDGNIKYLGRIDNQVKIRGNRVELGEIESCILSFKNVKDAAVIAPKDELGNSYLGAYIIWDKPESHEDLRHYIQSELPVYMIPSYFMDMDEFPLSSSGKLDRKALLIPKNDSSRGKYHAPVNDREEEICEVWEDVLKIEKISRDDNFFQIGGDSLSLIQVLFALQDRYDLTLQDLFEFQTIEALSQHIHKRDKFKIDFKEDEHKNIVKQIKCGNKIRDYYKSINNIKDDKDESFNSVLITGATGFLGAYIVKEYLENSKSKLLLIIRGGSDKAALERFLDKISFYFGKEYIKNYLDRVKVIAGDITDQNFTINESADAIIHCAADVRHFGDRESIYKTNVEGTRNMVNFAKSSGINKFCFISTLSLGLNSVKPGWAYQFTEYDNDTTENRGNVYIDSKILAEEIVQDFIKDNNGQILRIGNIVSDSETGKFQENYSNNAFYSILHEYKNMGVAPDIEIPFIDLSPVNEVAKAVRILSSVKKNGTFHLFNHNSFTLKEIFDVAGIKTVEFASFYDYINYGDSVLTHGYYLNDPHLLGYLPYNDYTTVLLEKREFSWSFDKKKLIKNVLTSFGISLAKKELLRV